MNEHDFERIVGIFSSKQPKKKKKRFSKHTAKRVVALSLCVSMVVSLVAFVLPTWADEVTPNAGQTRSGNSGRFDNFL